MRIGVLALQGSFAEHVQSFRRLGVPAPEVRLPEHLEGLRGLVIPGGESTTMSHLLDRIRLAVAPLSRDDSVGLPGLGDLRRHDPPRPPFDGPAHSRLRRNRHRREAKRLGPPGGQLRDGNRRARISDRLRFRAVFIRPPVITRRGAGGRASGPDSTTVAVVAVRQGNALATAFHPELTSDLRFHNYFVQIVDAAGTEAARTEGHRLDDVMTRPRAVRPTDLVALVSFDGRVYPNEAKTRERIGKTDVRAPPARARARAVVLLRDRLPHLDKHQGRHAARARIGATPRLRIPPGSSIA